jgi:hypothetical protein
VLLLQDFHQVLPAPLCADLLSAGVAAEQLEERHRLDGGLPLPVPHQDAVGIDVVVIPQATERPIEQGLQQV